MASPPGPYRRLRAPMSAGSRHRTGVPFGSDFSVFEFSFFDFSFFALSFFGLSLAASGAADRCKTSAIVTATTTARTLLWGIVLSLFFGARDNRIDSLIHLIIESMNR